MSSKKRYNYGVVRTADKTIAYFLDRKDGNNPVMHNLDGPALIRKDQEPEYYINGFKYSREDWENYIKFKPNTSTDI